MKKIISLILAFTFISQALFAQFSADVFKNKSNAEIIIELKNTVEMIKSIERLGEMFKNTDADVYAKDELEEAYFLDTLQAVAVFNEFRNNSFTIQQTTTENGSELLIDPGYFFKDLTSRGYKIEMIPKRFYFEDGTTADNVENVKLDFSFPEDIPFKKQIDRIDCELTLNYVTKYDTVEVTELNKIAKYKGLSLQLLKTDKNDMELTYHKNLNFDFMEGLNAEGKPLAHRSNSTTDLANRDAKVLSSLVKSLDKLVAAAEKDKGMEAAAFQKKYLNQFEQEFKKMPKSDILLRVAKYRGAIKGARFWIPSDSRTLNQKLTITRKS